MEDKIQFLLEIDKLKSVVRKTPLIDQSRRENSAEHSWHLAMYALILADQAEANIDVFRVIKMLLIHDIVEIDAGDHPIHEASASDAQYEKEVEAAKRLFGLLPGHQGEALLSLWLEFEQGSSDDAVFAKSLDRLQPLLHNVSTNGGTWIEANVTEDQVKERYGEVIVKGSVTLWEKARHLVEQHFRRKI